MRLWSLVLCLLQWAWCSSAYHVLVIYPVPSRSHNTLGKGVVDALLQAGHEVSWVTPYPPDGKMKGLNIIDVSITRPIVESVDMSSIDIDTSLVTEYARIISKTALKSPAFREALIKGNYDAVVTEHFFSDTDAGYVNSLSMQPNFEQQLDEVRSVSTIPLMFNSAEVPMRFWNRVVNSLLYGMETGEKWLGYTKLVALYEQLFTPLAAARGTTLPPFEDAHYNVSILFVNSHASFAPARSLPPNVIEIAGYHIQEDVPPLPKDLQELLDSSKQGVVYFSMGSLLNSTIFPDVTKRELLQMFGVLPYTVLWKFEEQLEGTPRNVHIRSWMPQASILTHPNVKVFITHGGLLSMLEALQNGVPLLAIPMFGDQPFNADRVTRIGFGRHITFKPDLATDLKVALHGMLTNDSYYKTAKYLSKLFRNRLVAPKKLISHYVEVAIESKGAYHLRSKSLLYAWYQRWMLDQLAVLLVILALLYVAWKCALRICLNKIRETKTTKLNKAKKK